MLNDRPLTYVSPDLKDPEPLIPSHLLYGRRIVSLPHPIIDEDEVYDPDYKSDPGVRKRARTMALLLKHFWTRWKMEYLTSLMDFHKTTGSNT